MFSSLNQIWTDCALAVSAMKAAPVSRAARSALDDLIDFLICNPLPFYIDVFFLLWLDPRVSDALPTQTSVLSGTRRMLLSEGNSSRRLERAELNQKSREDPELRTCALLRGLWRALTVGPCLGAEEVVRLRFGAASSQAPALRRSVHTTLSRSLSPSRIVTNVSQVARQIKRRSV
jgi:hypothetical protein